MQSWDFWSRRVALYASGCVSSLAYVRADQDARFWGEAAVALLLAAYALL